MFGYNNKKAIILKNSEKYEELHKYVSQYATVNLAAKNMLALCFQEGYGVEKNLEKAQALYSEAASGGNIAAKVNLGIFYEEVLRSYNSEELYRLYEDAAVKGNTEAQARLGCCYIQEASTYTCDAKGESIYPPEESPDMIKLIEKGIRLLKQAAKKHNTLACNKLADCYLRGKGVEQNPEEAARLLKISVKKNDISAYINLGNMYFYGCGVAHDGERAFSLYKFAAENDSPNAQLCLAICYFHGIGCCKDIKKAIYFWEKAEPERSFYYFGVSAYIAHYLVDCAVFGDRIGGNTQENRSKLIDLVKAAAENGSAKGLCALIYFYKHWSLNLDAENLFELQYILAQKDVSVAVQLGDHYKYSKEKEKAIKFYELAEKGGDAYSIRILGDYALDDKKYEKAIEYYTRAAAKQEPWAQMMLGDIYYNGKNVSKNDNLAYNYFLPSANSGNPISQMFLGFFFEKGIVVEKNSKTSLDWYNKAFSQADDESISDYEAFLTELRKEYEELQHQALVEERAAAIKESQAARELLDQIKSQHQQDIKPLSNDEIKEMLIGLSKKLDKGFGEVKDELGDVKDKLQEIQEQIGSLSTWIQTELRTSLQDSIAELNTKLLTAAIEDRDDIITDFIEKKVSEINSGISGSNVNSLVSHEEAYLKGIFGSIWETLCPETRISLRSARVLWRCCSDITDSTFDYSGICISLTAALESELKQVFFFGLQRYLLKTYGSPYDNRDNWPTILLHNNNLDNGKKTTLGSISYLLGAGYRQLLKDGDENKEIYPKLLKKKMTEYLHHIIKDTVSFNEPISLFTSTSSGFTKECDKIAHLYRNEAAHIGTINKEQVKDCYQRIVGNLEFAEQQGKITSLLIRLYSIIDIDKLANLPSLSENK